MSNRKDQILAMIKEGGKEPFLLFALAKEYEKSGDIAEAESTYEELVAEFPDYTGTYYHLVTLKIGKGKGEEARSVGLKGLDICKEQGDTHAYRELQALVDTIDN